MTTLKSENAVRITAKLYDARDFLRRMTTQEEYPKRIADYQGYIRQGMEKWKLDEIHSMMRLAEKFTHEPFIQAALFAAYVEMIEPST